MRLKDKLKGAGSVVRFKLFGKKAPLVVTWAVTNRCNFRCSYCGRGRSHSPELMTESALGIINQLSSLGCARISFSGGEPLLREDIGELLTYCKEKKISTTLITNGSLLAERIKEVKDADLIELSLDGPSIVNDLARSEGAFVKIAEAAKMIRSLGIKLIFNTVLTKYNIKYIDFMLDFSSKNNAAVMFGPVSNIHAKNIPIENLLPKKEEFIKAIEKLICEKNNGSPVANSSAALNYLRSWPYPKKITCYAGKAFCHISSDGKLYPCVAMEDKLVTLNCVNNGFEKAFKKMPEKIQCEGCWCIGTLEFNRLLACRPSALFSLWNLA